MEPYVEELTKNMSVWLFENFLKTRKQEVEVVGSRRVVSYDSGSSK